MAPALRKSGAGNRRPEHEAGDESAAFEWRARWFGDFHGDRSGRPLTGDAVRRLMAQVDALDRPTARSVDPGGPRPRRGFALVGVKPPGLRLAWTRNPRPKSSLGFVGRPVAVQASDEPRDAILKIALPQPAARTHDLARLRVFRFDEASATWQIVMASGVGATRSYAWARLHRRGRYVVIAPPADPWLNSAVALLHLYRPWLRRAAGTRSVKALLRATCDTLLPAPIMRGTAGAKLRATLGLSPFARGFGPHEIRRRVLGLELPRAGLPESQILDAAPDAAPPSCPPWPTGGPR